MSGDAVLAQAIDPAGDRAVYTQIAGYLRQLIGKYRLKQAASYPRRFS